MLLCHRRPSGLKDTKSKGIMTPFYLAGTVWFTYLIKHRTFKRHPLGSEMKCLFYNFDHAMRVQGFYHYVIVFLAPTVYQKVIRFSFHFKR